MRSLLYDEQVFDKRVRNTPGAAELLTEIKQALATIEPFEPAALEQTLKALVEKQQREDYGSGASAARGADGQGGRVRAVRHAGDFGARAIDFAH